MARRRRTKLGLGRTAVAAAAIAEVTGGKAFKHPITDSIRQAFVLPNMPGGALTKAAIMVVASQVAAIEMNKLGYNPAFGPVRLL